MGPHMILIPYSLFKIHSNLKNLLLSDLSPLSKLSNVLPSIQITHFEMQIIVVGGARIGLPSAPPSCMFFRRRFRLFLAYSDLSGLCAGGSTDLHLVRVVEAVGGSSGSVADVITAVLWWSETLFVVFRRFLCFFSLLFTGR